MDCVLNVDWLSIYGSSDLWCGDSDRLSEVLNCGTCSFDFVPLPYGTKHFVRAANVYAKGNPDPIANITYCPRSGILKPKAVIIKFSNVLLYTKNLAFMIEQTLYELHITAKSISRLDIALDFYEFANGMKPTKLIKSYINGNIKRVGKGVGRLFFEQDKDSRITYTGLQFGSKSSVANIYLYNKSKELSETRSAAHHDKPHIRKTWEEHGLNRQNQDVWRLEISLKPEALQFGDKDYGEWYDFSGWEGIEKNAPLIFGTYAAKLFKFVYPTDKNITRCKQLDLLPADLPKVNRVVVDTKHPSTIGDKVFIKKLLTSRKYKEILNNPDKFRSAIDVALGVIQSCDLEWWYNKKGLKIDDNLTSVKLLREWFASHAEDDKWIEQFIKFE